jgi:hypothetical protein
MRLKVLIVLFWIATMAVLVGRHYSPAVLPEASALPLGEHWMGIYQRGEKIGYAKTNVEPLKQGYRASESVFMKIKAMGVEKDIRILTDALLDKRFMLKSFTFEMKSDIDMRVEGVINGKSLTITMDTGGHRTEREMLLKEEPYMNISLIPALKEGLEVGKRIRLPVLEPSTLTEDTMELEVVGKENVKAMGTTWDSFKIRGSFMGAEVFMWVTEEGDVLKEESMGLTFIKEDKDDAVKLGSPSIDIIADMSIPFNMELPPGITNLTVKLKGIGFKGLRLHGDNQKLTGDILEIKKTIIQADTKEMSPTDAAPYIADTLFVQSKDPEIVSLAGEITKGEKDTAKKARLIHEWVYENIEKYPTITIPTAKEVLKSRRGDCNEHTTLFTALSRAAGIPTRIAVGLAYKEEYFYYHAWPEVYIGGWFAIDPTLGQWPADAAHIRLLTGGLDKQLRLVSVMGKLRIEGIEWR